MLFGNVNYDQKEKKIKIKINRNLSTAFKNKMGCFSFASCYVTINFYLVLPTV